MLKVSRFTLIELIIVIAIIAIIGAILIPSFLNTTDRARLRSDVQSARVLQNAMELYITEQGQPAGANIADVKARLDATGYVDSNRIRVQTNGAAFILYQDRVRLDLTGPQVPANVSGTLAGQLSPQELAYVRTSP